MNIAHQTVKTSVTYLSGYLSLHQPPYVVALGVTAEIASCEMIQADWDIDSCIDMYKLARFSSSISSFRFTGLDWLWLDDPVLE